MLMRFEIESIFSKRDTYAKRTRVIFNILIVTKHICIMYYAVHFKNILIFTPCLAYPFGDKWIRYINAISRLYLKIWNIQQNCMVHSSGSTQFILIISFLLNVSIYIIRKKTCLPVSPCRILHQSAHSANKWFYLSSGVPYFVN